MRDFSEYYATLGVPPDASWENVRAHYRSLIRQWHPDRFATDIGQQTVAEEHSKRITAAYQALEKYRRDHGALPSVSRAPMAAVDQTRGDRPASSDRSGPEEPAVSARGSAKARRGRRIALVSFALAAAGYLALNNKVAWVPNDSRVQETASQPGTAPALPHAAETPGAQRGIALGSTFGDVYAIQGIPSLTQGDIWHYGKSQVRFARGKVISWHEDPGNPLHVARNQPVPIRGGIFKLGSTKDEVRATQGTPVTETATVWDYGLSRVYFEDNRVVRWEESPMQRLRVPH